MNWHENLSKDDQPPKWMWTLDEELELHFADVEARRNDTFESPDMEEVPMMDNALINRRR